MATDDYMIFWSGTSIIMVLGGTLANAFISYQGVYVIAAVKDVFTIYGHAKVNWNILVDEVKKVLEWADIVGKKASSASTNTSKTTNQRTTWWTMPSTSSSPATSRRASVSS